MVQWRLVQLMGEYEHQTGQRLSLRRLSSETGLAETTISMIANNTSKRADLATVDRLLRFFQTHLNRTLCLDDLLHWNA